MSATARAALVALRNVVLGSNMMSLRLLRHPRRFVEYATENLFLYRSMDGRGVPEMPVHALLGGSRDEPIRLGNLHGQTWLQLNGSYVADLVNLCLLCRLLQPRRVFEIGTSVGYTALHMALNAPGARITTLDMPRDRTTPALPTTAMDDAHIRTSQRMQQHCFDGLPEASRIECVYGDSANFDFRPYHDAVDLFFIDGAHSYEYVRSDTRNALLCCRRGGVIAWHDFGRMGVNGVTRWLHEFAAEGHEVHAVPGGSLAYMLRR
jgi:hypothetical protein